jgi:hypothetical protein
MVLLLNIRGFGKKEKIEFHNYYTFWVYI